MDKFIENNKEKIKCWFYGHTHTPLYSYINSSIPLLCNTIGYPNKNNKIKIEILNIINNKIIIFNVSACV
jgi:hypothetical protein